MMNSIRFELKKHHYDPAGEGREETAQPVMLPKESDQNQMSAVLALGPHLRVGTCGHPGQKQ
jgi:hypothetical protein